MAIMPNPRLGLATISEKKIPGSINHSRSRCFGSNNYARPRQHGFDNHASKNILGLVTMFGSAMAARSKHPGFDIQKKTHGSGMVVKLRHLDKK